MLQWKHEAMRPKKSEKFQDSLNEVTYIELRRYVVMDKRGNEAISCIDYMLNIVQLRTTTNT